MSRILLIDVLPLILPAALYVAWSWYRQGYAVRHGGQAPKLEQGPWPLLLFLGAVLTLAVLGATALMRGGSPDETYVPPHLEQGVLIPGHLEPKKP